MWLSIELLAHACFYVRIRTTRGSLPHVVIIISAYRKIFLCQVHAFINPVLHVHVLLCLNCIALNTNVMLCGCLGI